MGMQEIKNWSLKTKQHQYGDFEIIHSRPKIDKHRLSKSLDGIVQFNSRDGPRVAEDWVPRLSIEGIHPHSQ
jgi:hypothetical protein